MYVLAENIYSFVNSTHGMCVWKAGVVVDHSYWGREGFRIPDRKEVEKTEQEIRFSVSCFRACSSLFWRCWLPSTQSKQGDYTHTLYRLPTAVLNSYFIFKMRYIPLISLCDTKIPEPTTTKKIALFIWKQLSDLQDFERTGYLGCPTMQASTPRNNCLETHVEVKLAISSSIFIAKLPIG